MVAYWGRLSNPLSVKCQGHFSDIEVLIIFVLCAVVSECRYRNGGCMQYCRDLTGGAGVQCSCADGFKVESDGQSCAQSGNTPSTNVLYECT